MAYTETTSKSWFTRLRESFGGIVTGFVLIAVGTWLLWWNEERTFKTAGAIGEAELVTQKVNDISKLDPALEGKVIYASGHADTKDILRDDLFGVSINALRLERNVEYYQWREHEKRETRKKLGGGEETVTTYTYSREWTDEPVDSNHFKDFDYVGRNTTLAVIKDLDSWAPNVTFGAYTLPSFLKHSIGGEQPMTIQSVDVKSLSGIVRVSNLESINDLITVSGSTVYIGRNPSSPRIGDVRVTFGSTPPADVSIIAQVIRNTFEQYRASNGYSFSRLSMGIVGMQNMFEGARSDNNFMAWVLRVVGIVCVFLGLRMVFSPLSVIADVIPILGTIVDAGAGFVCFVLALAWSLIVIAIAWLRFRPLLAGGLIALALALIFMAYAKGRKNNAQVV
ncbi:MAG: TMEM43 family protein [Synergistaceae bacterium]|nr:TMEM43 family protein [Synergistaceae bacterium]